MNNAKQLAKHEINWWKAHHRGQKDLLLREMALLYKHLFDISEDEAIEVVHFRVEAASLHDQAEKFEDEGDISKAEEYWTLAENTLYSHFETLLRLMHK